MSQLFEDVKNINTEACVSIILNTHRTHPDNEQDPILLGNLVKEAKDRLHADFEKRFVWPIEEKLDQLVSEIDHNYNLDSLVIFVNQDFAGYERLATKTVDRVVIGNTFATRDLIRAKHEHGSYYVLLLSNDQARLFEAFNNRLEREVKGDFPFTNNLKAKNAEELTHSSGTSNLVEEFFNHVDKSFQKETADRHLPLLIATEARNYDHYLNVADHKDLIIGQIDRFPDNEDGAKVVSEAWEKVQLLVKEKNAKRIEELQIAVSQNMFLTDYSEIWFALQAGRGKTIFVKRGFYQPAIVTEEAVELVEDDQIGQENVIDDIIDEMIEINLAMGGDVVFIENDDLADFQNLSLVTRY